MKRWIPIVFAAVILATVSLLAGMVLAQGGVPSSGEVGQVPTGDTGGQEGEPAGSAGAGPAVSSADGGLTVARDDATLEAPPEVGASTSAGSGSSTDAGVPVAPRDWPEETAPVGYESSTNAPEYNTSVRFVGSAMKPRENNVSYTVESAGGCVYVSAGDDNTVWNLPLALPEGSEVEYVRIYVRDTNVSENTCGWFTKYDLYGTLIQEWSVCSDGSHGNRYWTRSISPTETIDYGTYSYALNWRPGATGDAIQICGMRLYYTAPFRAANFLPALNK